MDSTLTNILQQLKRGLEDLYGPRLRGLYLFGSHARGEAEEGSDIDVAMVLDDFEHASTEIMRTGEIVGRLSLEHDCVLSVIPLRLRQFADEAGPLVMNLRREGVAVH